MPHIDRYHEVFVSSTYVDLVEERQAVLQTLLKLNCLPVGMELFPNGDPDVWALIRRLIERCDVYVLIVGGRYGTRCDETGLSYTHREFLEAVNLKKPIFVYPHVSPQTHKPEFWERQSDEERTAIKSFHSAVTQRATKPWADMSQLRTNVVIDFATCVRDIPAGWTRVPEDIIKTFAGEIAAIESRFETAEVRALTKLLQNTLQQFQFNQTKARLEKLGELLPWLSKKDWEVLVDFARAQAMVRAEPAAPADQPMKRAIVDMVQHYQAQLHDFESGIIEVEGELINPVSGYFIGAVRQSFRALSNNDFGFWSSEESEPYYKNTKELISKDIAVERIFVAPQARFSEEVVAKVIRRQIADGVKVRIISSEALRRLVPSKLDRDFGLHDRAAVSFFRNYYGRSYKVDTRQWMVSRFLARFDAVAKNAQAVPGKTTGDQRLFESLHEFEAWLTQVPSPCVAAPASSADDEDSDP